ncbi:hypothetical protein F511_40098 [Dorcoceras hygrometricum]|uniref:Uncharacterized protein n=1 Tax=Dorcoceras hygrometricum TaxID=472368 RepID=A0A2Z7ANX0_9LAMI|nr:hypothetical protein F511_40098 [Dorcoceras hygrometricum]
MWYPKTEHYSVNLIYVIKGEGNQKAHAELGNLYRGLATSSGDALTPALSRGASNLRRRSKLGIPPEASYPKCWRILPGIPEDHGVSRPPEIYAELVVALALSHALSDLSIGGLCRTHFPRPLTSYLWPQAPK